MPVIFHPDRCVPPSSRYSAHSFDGVRLEAGMNLVSGDELALLKNHPDFDRYRAWNAIEVIEGELAVTVNPAANAGIPDLSSYSVEDAETIVWDTHDEAILTQWLGIEPRKTLRQIINRRITQIKGGVE